jgi:basic membrane protein A
VSRRSLYVVSGGAAVIAIAIVLVVVLTGNNSGGFRSHEKFRAGLVADARTFHDDGVNAQQLEGLREAALHVAGVRAAAAFDSRSPRDYRPNLTALADKGYNFIIGASGSLAAQEKALARQFPKIKFAITGVDVTRPPFNGKVSNIEGLTFATQENAYLAGCLAGLMAKRQGGRQVVGVVAGAGLPLVAAPVAGYAAGARHCDPGVTVLTSYTHDLTNKATCRSLARQHMKAGSQVELSVAGKCGLGALEAAGRAGIWAIASGVDQPKRYPEHVLASVVTRVDRGIFVAIQNAERGEFVGGGNLSLNLKNGGVSLGKINASVPETFVRQINQLKAQIVAGKLKPPTGV